MMNVIQLTGKLKSYIIGQIDLMVQDSPMIGFVKPFITRAIDKNFSKVSTMLNMVTDEEGNVDVEGILTEITENLMTTKPFVFRNSIMGDIEVGGGAIKFNIPLTDKRLVLNKRDLDNFREALTTIN